MAGGRGIGLSPTGCGVSPGAAAVRARPVASPGIGSGLTVRFFRHRGIYRSEVGVGLRQGSPLRGSALSSPSASTPRLRPGFGEGSGARSVPRSRSSSAMSSGRLFLDRVARQQSPSPLHRHEQNITASRKLGGKEDISTLPGRGHFYFALTRTYRRLDTGIRR
jgi:hypothetical protein